MPLYSYADLLAKGRRKALNKSMNADELLKSASAAKGSYDVFLSYTTVDARVIYGLKDDIEEMGYSVYVDWIDSALDRNDVSYRTASTLQKRMQRCKCLFFVTTENFEQSRWMIWELGYFDGYRGRVAILPITKTADSTYRGQEYLGLYPYVTKDTIEGTSEEALWVNRLGDTYVALDQWLEGKKPYRH